MGNNCTQCDFRTQPATNDNDVILERNEIQGNNQVNVLQEDNEFNPYLYQAKEKNEGGAYNEYLNKDFEHHGHEYSSTSRQNSNRNSNYNNNIIQKNNNENYEDFNLEKKENPLEYSAQPGQPGHIGVIGKEDISFMGGNEMQRKKSIKSESSLAKNENNILNESEDSIRFSNHQQVDIKQGKKPTETVKLVHPLKKYQDFSLKETFFGKK